MRITICVQKRQSQYGNTFTKLVTRNRTRHARRTQCDVPHIRPVHRESVSYLAVITLNMALTCDFVPELGGIHGHYEVSYRPVICDLANT